MAKKKIKKFLKKLAPALVLGLGAAALGRGRQGTSAANVDSGSCLLYTSPSPRDRTRSRMPSSA